MIPYVPESEYEPYDLGQLTNTGWMQAYELGSILRKRYQNFLSDVYNAEDLYAYSSDSDRTTTTLQFVLVGLYLPTSALLWNSGHKWLPISYRYIPAQFDILFKPMMGQTFGKIFRRETDHLIRAKNTNEYSDIIAFIKDKFGMDIWSDGREDSLSGVFNVLHCHKRMGIPVLEWCTHKLLERLKDYFVFDMKRYSHTQQMKRMNGGPLIKKFVDNMNFNETLHNPRRMCLYSGHAMNIFAVVSALAIEDYEYPDYASAIIIEKLRDVDNQVYGRLIGRRGDRGELRTLKLRIYLRMNSKELLQMMSFSMTRTRRNKDDVNAISAI